MAFLDNLTSEQAVKDANTIRATVSTIDTSSVKVFFNDLLNKLEILAYNEIAGLTIDRNKYDMARMVRKRNGIWKALNDLNTSYAGSATFFDYFKGSDQELISKINQVQSIMNSLNAIYLDAKYRSKESEFIQTSVAQGITQVSAIRTDLTDFKNFFLR